MEFRNLAAAVDIPTDDGAAVAAFDHDDWVHEVELIVWITVAAWSLLDGPPEVCAARRGRRENAHFLASVVTNIADVEIPRQPVEGESPWFLKPYNQISPRAPLAVSFETTNGLSSGIP